MDEERFALFRLSLVHGLGPARLRGLLERFGSAVQVLRAGSKSLQRVKGIGAELAAAIIADSSDAAAHAAYDQMIRLQARMVFESDEEFPAGLREIPSPPLMLMVRGELLPTDRIAVAIVGSRHCSPYGQRIAGRLARDLATRGITVVSGLARGIDGAAHQAALAAGGRTIAVLASGLARIYPPEHLELAEQVVTAGALVSEAPLEGPPIGNLFPQRNRLISGLSLGVVVVEASERSGALSTARHALDQNREVFAVPGRVGEAASLGANRLIQQGAHLVSCADDILDQLGPVELTAVAEKAALTCEPPAALGDIDRKLWDALDEDGIDFETLLEKTELRASEASSALLMMEMRKLVRRCPGNRYTRV